MMTAAVSRRAQELAAEGTAFVTRDGRARAAARRASRRETSRSCSADGTIEGFVGGVCAQQSVRVVRVEGDRDRGGAALANRSRRADRRGSRHGPRGRDRGGSRDGPEPVPVRRRDRDLPRAGAPGAARPRRRRHADRGGGHVARRRARARRSSPSRAAPRSRRAGDLALVVAAHGRDELHTLRRGLEAGVPYVGLVASRKRGAGVLDELRADGVPERAARAHRRARRDRHRRAHARPRSRCRSSRGSSPCAAGAPADGAGAASRRARARRRRPAPLAIDPICGMTVAAVAGTPSVRARRRDGLLLLRGLQGQVPGAARARRARRSEPAVTREVTGEAAGEIRRLVPDIETLARRLADVDYLVDEGLATSMFLEPAPAAAAAARGRGRRRQDRGREVARASCSTRR